MQILNYGTKIDITNVSNVNIQNCNITEVQQGVRYFSSSGIFSNNNLTSSTIYHGFVVEGSTVDCFNNTITKTSPNTGRGVGIYYVSGSSGNFAENDVSGWDWGFGATWSASPNSFASSAPSRNNRIRNCNYGLVVYRQSSVCFGVIADTRYARNSVDNTINARVGMSYTTYYSYLLAHQNWWGSNPPNTSKFQIGSNAYFDYQWYLSSDPWAGFAKIIAGNVGNSPNPTQNPIEPLLAGIDLRNQNKYKEAKDFFKDYLAEHPDNQAAYVDLYSCYNKETSNDIINFFNNLPEKASKDHKLLLSFLYLKEGNDKEAKKINNKIIAENPNTSLATRAKLNNIYITLYNENNIDGAINDFNEVINKDELSTPMELSLVQQAIESYGTTYGVEIKGLAKIPDFISTEEDSIDQNGLAKTNIPDKYELFGNYPNPFNPSTIIRYSLPFQSSVELVIYDVMGKEVKSYNIYSQSAGNQNIFWDGTNKNGITVSSGIYLYRISIKSLENNQAFVKTAKLLMLK